MTPVVMQIPRTLGEGEASPPAPSSVAPRVRTAVETSAMGLLLVGSVAGAGVAAGLLGSALVALIRKEPPELGKGAAIGAGGAVALGAAGLGMLISSFWSPPPPPSSEAP